MRGVAAVDNVKRYDDSVVHSVHECIYEKDYIEVRSGNVGDSSVVHQRH